MQTTTIKVSSRNQVALPSEARKKLGILPGDRLLVDVQDGVLVLIPQPQDYVTALAGLYREVWEDVDTNKYIDSERDAWLTTETSSD